MLASGIAVEAAGADEPLLAFCKPLLKFYPEVQSCPAPWLSLPASQEPQWCKRQPERMPEDQWMRSCGQFIEQAIAENKKNEANRLALQKAQDEQRQRMQQSPPDPYAEEAAKGASQEYRRTRKFYLDQIEYAYFAVGCKVFGSEAAINGLVYSYMRVLQEDATSLQIFDKSIDDLAQASRRAGLSRATPADACAYWHQNPEAVTSLRRLAAAAE